jgi:hypothetical protein
MLEVGPVAVPAVGSRLCASLLMTVFPPVVVGVVSALLPLELVLLGDPATPPPAPPLTPLLFPPSTAPGVPYWSARRVISDAATKKNAAPWISRDCRFIRKRRPDCPVTQPKQTCGNFEVIPT